MTTQSIKHSEEAIQGAQTYFAAYPGSRSALHRPGMSVRHGTTIATLGRAFQEKIVGIGMTVDRALRSMDAQYLAALKPPTER